MVPSRLDQPAADVLNSVEGVAVRTGHRARGAVAEVPELTELLGAGVAKALLGKDVLSDELSCLAVCEKCSAAPSAKTTATVTRITAITMINTSRGPRWRNGLEQLQTST
jgi:hypothetical protein